jgi:hypothetical protein
MDSETVAPPVELLSIQVEVTTKLINVPPEPPEVKDDVLPLEPPLERGEAILQKDVT